MGYLICGHAVRATAPFQHLDALLSSIAWRVYTQPGVNAYFIETFDARYGSETPFASGMPLVKELPKDLPDGLESLTELYHALEELDLAAGFPREYVNLGLQISTLLDTTVLSFGTDDDLLDFVCVTQQGTLSKLHCVCEDLDITYSATGTTIQPLLDEEDDEPFYTDLEALRDLLPGATILPRNTPMSNMLHDLSMREMGAFLSTDNAPLGMGSFDLDEVELHLECVSARLTPANVPCSQPIATATTKPTKRWWEFWKS